MKLSIVIPVYDEEAVVQSVISSCLQSKEHIIAKTPLKEVEIIVVNDGSNDKTLSIVQKFKDITILDFKTNRGYGAALKSGFEISKGNLVGFLDGDGTCDPLCFIDLCNAIFQKNADIAIGLRTHSKSKMPKIRKLGNMIFESLINFLGSTKIRDSASGMRVMRKEVLDKIYPLPDGLNFTPAMTCRIIMDGKLKITEIPITYEERRGTSKLGVLKDGLRFFQIVLFKILIKF